MTKIETYPLLKGTISVSGKYWVGDPSYVFSDKDWESFEILVNSKVNDFDDKNRVRVINVDDSLIYTFQTRYGDGRYPLVKNNNYKEFKYLSVDSGYLAIIPIRLLDRKGWKKQYADEYGEFLEFSNVVDIKLEFGDLKFGHIKILTGSEIDEYI